MPSLFSESFSDHFVYSECLSYDNEVMTVITTMNTYISTAHEPSVMLLTLNAGVQVSIGDVTNTDIGIHISGRDCDFGVAAGRTIL